jgi:hypothetical protein
MAEGPSPSLRCVKGTIEPPTMRLPDLTARSSELLHREVMRDRMSLPCGVMWRLVLFSDVC